MVKKNVVAGSGFQSRTVNGVVGVGAANKSTGDELQVPSNPVYNPTCFFYVFLHSTCKQHLWMKIQKSISPIVTKPTPSVVVLTVTGTRSKKNAIDIAFSTRYVSRSQQ